MRQDDIVDTVSFVVRLQRRINVNGELDIRLTKNEVVKSTFVHLHNFIRTNSPQLLQ